MILTADADGALQVVPRQSRRHNSSRKGRLSVVPTESCQQPSDELTIAVVAGPDPRLAAWDQLVANTPDNDVARLSTRETAREWSRYEPLYVLAFSGSELLGGVLLLRRRLPDVGWVAYLPHGPVLAEHVSAQRPMVLRRLMQALIPLASQHAALFAQPPDGDVDITGEL